MCLGILVAAVSKNYTMATHIIMGTNVLFSCLCGKLFVHYSIWQKMYLNHNF